MGRKEASKNVKEKTEAKYRVTTWDFIEDKESSKDFATIKGIAEYMKMKGINICENTIYHYMSGHRSPPQTWKFTKL